MPIIRKTWLYALHKHSKKQIYTIHPCRHAVSALQSPELPRIMIESYDLFFCSKTKFNETCKVLCTIRKSDQEDCEVPPPKP